MNIGKESALSHFTKMGVPNVGHLPSVPMHREEKNRKKKGKKRTASSEDVRKEEEPARQGRL